jgi:hypothetical protein
MTKPKDELPLEELEFKGLEALETEPDPSEVGETASEDPPSDSPGDEALLEQEEQYEGIESGRLPSAKAGRKMRT